MRFPFILMAICVSACVEEPVDGRTAYMENCASCHGVDAKGDGPAARGLAVAPPDLCLLYTSPSPRDRTRSRMPSSA